MDFIKRMIISTFAILAASYLLPGVKIYGTTIFGEPVNAVVTSIIVAVVLSFLNSVVKPIMVVLTIPVTILTLGLFLIVINALLILLASHLVDGFVVNSFWWAFLFSILLTMITSILNSLIGKPQSEQE